MLFSMSTRILLVSGLELHMNRCVSSRGVDWNQNGFFSRKRWRVFAKTGKIEILKIQFSEARFDSLHEWHNLHTIRCASLRGVDWCQNRSIICDNEAYFGRNAKCVLIQFREYFVKFVFRPYRTIYRRYRIDLYTKRCVSTRGVDWYQNQVVWTNI